jgi:hypothetical protein
LEYITVGILSAGTFWTILYRYGSSYCRCVFVSKTLSHHRTEVLLSTSEPPQQHNMLHQDIYRLLGYILTSALTWVGYEWSRSSPLRHSPDTTSPMYPDRPIRPLPKRRLRARLSPEQAESIVYPPAPPSSAPLFSFPYSQIEKASNIASRQQRGEHEHTCNCGGDHSELESDEEEDERAAALQSSPSLLQYTRNLIGAKAAGEIGNNFSKPSSTSSSADGYESFENTNNKKKRKIPNMGSVNTHHTNLSAEMASMGISSHPRDVSAHEDGEGGVGHYYGSGSSAMQTTSSGTGISGAGRGRYARSS